MLNKNIYSKTNGRMSLPQFQMLGFVLILIGGYLIYHLNWIGLLVIVVGGSLFFTVAGIQIDFSNKNYREFVGLFGYKIGKWVKLPKIDYVTIFNANYAQRGSVASIDKTHTYSKVKVSLIVSITEKYNAGLFENKEKALETGKVIARELDCRLLDYTHREAVWVDLSSS